MRVVKYFAVLFLISSYCISCKETVDESLQILIQNRTDRPVHVSLYPNDKYIIHEGMYHPSGMEGTGGGKLTDFTLPPNNGERLYWDEVVFVSIDLNIDPNILVSEAFDSICIRMEDHVIIFTHANVTGYTENIFSENASWDYRVREETYHHNSFTFTPSQHRYYQYRFLILKDKILINKNEEHNEHNEHN